MYTHKILIDLEILSNALVFQFPLNTFTINHPDIEFYINCDIILYGICLILCY